MDLTHCISLLHMHLHQNSTPRYVGVVHVMDMIWIVIQLFSFLLAHNRFALILILQLSASDSVQVCISAVYFWSEVFIYASNPYFFFFYRINVQTQGGCLTNLHVQPPRSGVCWYVDSWPHTPTSLLHTSLDITQCFLAMKWAYTAIFFVATVWMSPCVYQFNCAW